MHHRALETAGAPKLGWGETYETIESLPNPEPRFNLLISLINHSPSSYPFQGSGFSPAQVPEASRAESPPVASLSSGQVPGHWEDFSWALLSAASSCY